MTTAAAVLPHDPQLVSDNAGGAIIAWRDSRNAKTAIHSQRINNVAAAQWAVDGVAVSTGTIEDYPRLVADGTGGTIITWADMRNSVSNIYAQRIDKNGVTHWAVTDVAISNSISSAIMKTPYIAPDGVGGR